jgi:hypothetical protein
MGEKRPEKGGGGRGRFCSYFVSALALVVGVGSWSEGREGGRGGGEREREREKMRGRRGLSLRDLITVIRAASPDRI